MRALAPLLLAVFAQAQAQLIVLEGTVSADDHQSYLKLPFDVPPATERLSVRFDYERGAGVVLDLGLEDPERRRGSATCAPAGRLLLLSNAIYLRSGS